MNTMTMLEDKGPEYVERWAPGIAQRLGLSSDYVTMAVGEVMGEDADLAVIGSMTGEQAMTVVRRVTEIRDAIASRAARNCYSCGLPLSECDCGCGESHNGLGRVIRGLA